MKRLDGKIALITCGIGFGLGIATTFAREGAQVALIDLDREAVERAAGDIGTARSPSRPTCRKERT